MPVRRERKLVYSMEQTKEERLGTAPLGRLILSMALPAVAAQIINVLYNIVDRIYIGHMHCLCSLTGSDFPKSPGAGIWKICL